MKRLRRWAMGVVAILLALGLVVLAIATILAFTENGTRLLISQAERILPLKTRGVQGALADRLNIDHVRYSLPDHDLEIIELDLAFHLWALLAGDRLQFEHLRAQRLRLTERQPKPDAEPSAPEFPASPITIGIDSATIEHVELLDAAPMAIQLNDAVLDARHLRVVSARLQLPEVTVLLAGTLDNRRPLALRADVQWSMPDTGWSGQGSVAGPLNSVHLQHRIQGDYAFTLAGTADLTIPVQAVVDLDVTMDDVELGESGLRTISGTLRGTIEDLELTAIADLETPWLHPLALNVQTRGPVTGPITYTLTTAPLSGTLNAQGHLDWSGELEIALNGRAANLRLEELDRDLVGNVSSDITLLLEGSRVSGALRNLEGMLHGRTIGGSAAFSQAPSAWTVENADLQVGQNQLRASGTYTASSISATGEFNAKDLAELGLGVAGELQGNFELQGDPAAPDGALSLTAAQLVGFGATVDNLNVTARAHNGALSGALSTSQTSIAAIELPELQAKVEGSWSQFNWIIDWRDGGLHGSIDRTSDTGSTSVGLGGATTKFANEVWALEQPTRAFFSASSARVKPFCVTSSSGRVCVQELTSGPDTFASRGVLENLPVKLLAPWLPLQLADGGYLEGTWGMQREAEDWSGEVRLAARKLAIQTDLENTEDGAATSIVLPDLIMQGELEQNLLAVNATLSNDAFAVGAKATVAPLSLDGSVDGQLTVSATQLDPLRAFDQRLQRIDGAVTGRLALAGTPRNPSVEGKLNISEGVIEINDPDLSLQDVQLALTIDESGLFEITASARQDESELHVRGQGTELFLPSRRFEASVIGQDLQAEHPSWEIGINPDLRFAFAEGRGHLTGHLTIPRAKVRVNVLPAAAPRISTDVRVLGRKDETTTQPARLTADVNIVLGKDVELKTVGVTAELTGELRARRDTRERTTLHGTLDIAGGVMSTQGQSLTIESGVVRYDGPVEDPYLDVRAVRVIDNQTPTVKVGVHIRGRADNLTSSIFSEPPMSDTRALSFLILGRDFDATSEQDSGQLMSAAINLGLQSSKSIVSDVRRAVGLDELSAMAESQNSFAIVAGKRIGPSLYVRYTYDTLAALGALLVRYNLTKRWHLEAQSGESSAMDLFYTIEK